MDLAIYIIAHSLESIQTTMLLSSLDKSRSFLNFCKLCLAIATDYTLMKRVSSRKVLRKVVNTQTIMYFRVRYFMHKIRVRVFVCFLMAFFLSSGRTY